MSSFLLAVTGNCEGVGGRVALQPCSVFSVQYAIGLASVSKFTASTAGILSPLFSMGQGRLSEARKKSSKLKSKGELWPTMKVEELTSSSSIASCSRKGWA